MTSEQCRAFWVRWFEALYVEKRASIIDECIADSCSIIGLPAEANGRAAFHGFYALMTGAFPEVRVTVEDALADGEKFAVRCSAEVTDRAGTLHRVSGGAMGKIREGKVIEAWNFWEFHLILESMGVIPRDIVLRTFEYEKAKA